MPDINAPWYSDLLTSSAGDLAVIDGAPLGVQRILRRLFTNAANGTLVCADYFWHLAYGAGLPSRVGSTIDPALLASIIRSQILMESMVAATPAPVITVAPFPNGVTVSIQYVDGLTGLAQYLSFDVSQ